MQLLQKAAFEYVWWATFAFPEPPRKSLLLCARDWDGGEDVRQNAIGVEAFELGFRLETDAVAQDGRQGALDVVRDKVAAIFESGYGLGYAHEAQCRTGAGAQSERRPVSGAADQGQDVGEEFRLDADGALRIRWDS
jgi:hypothetical protein